ncbi:MAG: hypothetical protein INR64_03255 [Caulobacteraceae bacterium]|nr:hypothetical protein [Caulobacter sp.]
MGKLGWTLGAVAGGLVGGAAISALMITGERRSGEPSELIALERAGAERIGAPAPAPASAALPDAREQAVTQGGHLVLSAIGGVAYAAAFDEDAPLVLSGLGFGAAFWALAHGLLKPVVSTSAPEWSESPKIVGVHLAVHAVFGLCIAAGARLGAVVEREFA